VEHILLDDVNANSSGSFRKHLTLKSAVSLFPPSASDRWVIGRDKLVIFWAGHVGHVDP